jgi:LacI family transcriptional regulator
MRRAVEYLVARGHRKIAHFAGADVHSDALQRRVGFEAAMRENDLEIPTGYIVAGSWSGAPEKNPQAAADILELDATAVICSNDGQALLLWRMAEEKGRRVPEELSIIGMDNTVEAAQRGLSSLATPFEEIGRQAMGAVLGLIRGEDAESLCRVIPVELVERQSVARLKRHTAQEN